jgi:AcrR family transcriptional regulator
VNSREYSSAVREEQALRTRSRIIEAAGAEFDQRGYVGTTMAQIARSAGVSPQTVYNSFGSKAAVLKAVYDVRLIGDDDPVPMSQRPEIIAMLAATDARAVVHMYAQLGKLLMQRLVPMLRMVHEGAAAGDSDLQELVATTGRERLMGVAGFIRKLTELDALREGLGADDARDAVWTLNSFQVWDLLVRERGWSADKAADWIERAMADAILRP